MSPTDACGVEASSCQSAPKAMKGLKEGCSLRVTFHQGSHCTWNISTILHTPCELTDKVAHGNVSADKSQILCLKLP